MNQIVGKLVDGTPFLVLQLEPGNLHRMQLGQPAVVHIEDFFPDGIPKKLELAVALTATPVADARELAKKAEMTFNERAAAPPKQPHCPECKSTIEQLGVWRNESPMAIAFCPVCGCSFGMVPSEVARSLKAGA